MSKISQTPRASFEPFDHDILVNRGYKYSKNAPLSSRLSNSYLTELTKHALVDLMSCAQIKTVIDLGCGDGLFTSQLARRLAKLTFVGSDAAKQAIQIAKVNYPQLDFRVWNMMKKSSESHYDVAILRGVIHHLPDPEKGIRHATQICRYLIVIEPNGWNPILKVIEKTSPYHLQHHERSYTNYQLSHWFQNSRFLLVDQKFVGLVPFFCPSWLAKLLKKLEPWVEKSWLAPLLCAQVVQIYKKK